MGEGKMLSRNRVSNPSLGMITGKGFWNISLTTEYNLSLVLCVSQSLTWEVE